MGDHVLAVQHKQSGRWGLLKLHGRVATIIRDAEWACPWTEASWSEWSGQHLNWLQTNFSSWLLMTETDAQVWVDAAGDGPLGSPPGR